MLKQRHSFSYTIMLFVRHMLTITSIYLQGCKALMARNEKSILMMIVTTVDDAKDVSNEDEKDDKKSSKAKRKSCAVQ